MTWSRSATALSGPYRLDDKFLASAHNLHRAWYASGRSCSQEILTCTYLLVYQNNIKTTSSRNKWRMIYCTYEYCSSIRYISKPSQNTIIACPSNFFSQSFVAWIHPLDIAWVTSFVALVLNTTLAWDSFESLLKRYRLFNMKLKHYQINTMHEE
jgi:hypothetical protein